MLNNDFTTSLLSLMTLVEPLLVQFLISQALAHLLHAFYYRQTHTWWIKLFVSVSLVAAQVAIMFTRPFLVVKSLLISQRLSY